MLKYDHGKLADILLDEYHKKFGGNGNPSATINKLIECMDDAFVDEFIKLTSEISENINREAVATMDKANKTLQMLRDEIRENEETAEKAMEAEAVHDEKVADALKAYQTIVNMKFDTPQQTLQNIQNASYFIWALYYQNDGSNAFFRAIQNNEISNVKEEDKYDSKAYHELVY